VFPGGANGTVVSTPRYEQSGSDVPTVAVIDVIRSNPGDPIRAILPDLTE
jgi:hypothetical protein